MPEETRKSFTLRDLLWFLSLPLGMILLGSLMLMDFGEQVPLLDAQGHYDPEVWRRASPEAVINTLEELDVIAMVVSSNGNDGADSLLEVGGHRILPMLSLYEHRDERDDWHRNPIVLERLERGLRRSDYVGVGEVHLYDGLVHGKVVEGLVQRVADSGLVLNVHGDALAIEQLFNLEPRLRVLWAHAGMRARPSTVGKMLDRHLNLVVELSHRLDVAPRGDLAAEWRELFLRHPDRFMIGSGTYNDEYWYQLRYTLNAYRDWLQQLPSDVAENIAYRNGLRVFLNNIAGALEAGADGSYSIAR